MKRSRGWLVLVVLIVAIGFSIVAGIFISTHRIKVTYAGNKISDKDSKSRRIFPFSLSDLSKVKIQIDRYAVYTSFFPADAREKMLPKNGYLNASNRYPDRYADFEFEKIKDIDGIYNWKIVKPNNLYSVSSTVIEQLLLEIVDISADGALYTTDISLAELGMDPIPIQVDMQTEDGKNRKYYFGTKEYGYDTRYFYNEENENVGIIRENLNFLDQLDESVFLPDHLLVMPKGDVESIYFEHKGKVIFYADRNKKQDRWNITPMELGLDIKDFHIQGLLNELNWYFIDEYRYKSKYSFDTPDFMITLRSKESSEVISMNIWGNEKEITSYTDYSKNVSVLENFDIHKLNIFINKREQQVNNEE